jgi:hypothetical protein
MRTTLTLDDDVAARLKQLQGFSRFEEAVNQALRAGLKQLEKVPANQQQPYRVHAVDLGPKIMNVDNIAEILDIIEDDEGTYVEAMFHEPEAYETVMFFPNITSTALPTCKVLPPSKGWL